ncbi:cell division protein FtsL [Paracoccus sp. S3-43]|uniref:cell division protein FtsL n=1 Tax=Paracoccus sp. S3-43 TaxID=3030011 RepID=UPI0023AF53F8|nr:cell division protein FtsL [Paracoccus sp. S3-43]WEF23670.1 cell division protein FtsL [Paracoccus sp. S3-43]
MRPLTYLACALLVMGLAFWAYRENYRTQASLADMRQIQREIAGLREDLGVLRAEWAYLNRPERLRELVDLNFDRLQLIPRESGQVMGLGHIDYPKPPPPPEPAPEAGAVPGADAAPQE